MDSLLIALGFLLLLTVSSAFVIGRTAKSKGYSFGLFFLFGILSYLITAVVTVFLRPKGDSKAKPKISSVALLALGVVVEFTGLNYIPQTGINGESDAEAVAALIADPQFTGGVAIALAGILIVVGAVANDYRGSEPKQVRQL